MDIAFLLNSPDSDAKPRTATPPAPPASNNHHTVHAAASRRQKLAKDAPIFVKGTNTVGHVNYPPHEAGEDTDLQAQHRQLKVHPLGQISELSVRHIPYVSDKKHFKEKTGREAFEVFQYTFMVPGDEKKYLVVWDYNNGLVRMTPFFKSFKYSKTVPAKALNQNPGLKDISYSITGGALVCQGYWVPWHAARELAATFCWNIRWALTPVFGNDFPDMCIPHRHVSFGNFIISPDTVRFCTEETARFKEEKDSYRLIQSGPASPSVPMEKPFFDTPIWQNEIFSSPAYLDCREYNAEYDKATYSTQVSPHSLHTPSHHTSAEKDVILSSPALTWALTPQSPESPALDAWHSEPPRTKRTHSKVAYDDGDDKSDAGQPDENRQAHDYSTDELVAADILLSIGVVTRNAAALPKVKRIRRGSDNTDTWSAMTYSP
ncbi:hypothetical protein E8E13_008343 [Curvularia kusanoi]|uniref:HTH APSES-type domain-containing protein n=1 Tax=Curvularia kusanoi TaxID=90978 RepID=A0A9P4TKN4_CURKU|nr:hypothetical protein E8E13_008343 [Curvularia kusanoi]